MSGEASPSLSYPPASGWTVDTLHAHLLDVLGEMDRRYQERYVGQQEAVNAALAAQKEAVAAALTAADRALLKAEAASEKRFEGVNEFRATLSDQAQLLMPRGEAQTLIRGLAEQVSELRDRVNRSEGKGSGYGASWAIALAVIGLISTLLAIGALVVNLTR